jgi:hypothetical protein
MGMTIVVPKKIQESRSKIKDKRTKNKDREDLPASGGPGRVII